MKPIEDDELSRISGSASQQELLEFLERVLRETRPQYSEPLPVPY